MEKAGENTEDKAFAWWNRFCFVFLQMKRMILSIMSKIELYIYQYKAWMIAVSWMLLLSLFTYTEMACGLLKADIALLDVYTASQTAVIALVVNIGLLFMLVFDFMGAGKHISNSVVISIMVAVLLSVLVFGASRLHASGQISHYVAFLQNQEVLYGFHLLFLCILTWLKFKSIEDECKVEVEKVKKKF